MSEPSVIVTKDARGVATVAINRPQVRNAIDDTVIRSLTDAFKTLGADDETRIVVLTGRGVAFSAGADLDWMRRMAAAAKRRISRAQKRSARCCARSTSCQSRPSPESTARRMPRASG